MEKINIMLLHIEQRRQTNGTSGWFWHNAELDTMR